MHITKSSKMPKSKNKTLKIKHELKSDGLLLKTNGFKFRLIYPENIWQAYPEKQKRFLIDNLVYLLTVNIPFISGKDTIIYEDISIPLILSR